MVESATEDLLTRMSRYRNEASWAIWERNPDGKLAKIAGFPHSNVNDIHGRAMFVSLNPASNKSNQSTSATPDWSNFHNPNPRHNDRFLAEALVGTPFWGSYLTDLHPNVSESKSQLVNPESHAVTAAVDSLIAQAQMLGSVEAIICVGKKAFASISAQGGRIHAALGPTSMIAIPHYSGTAARVHKGDPQIYRAVVHKALGLQT